MISATRLGLYFKVGGRSWFVQVYAKRDFERLHNPTRIESIEITQTFGRAYENNVGDTDASKMLRVVCGLFEVVYLLVS